MENLIELNPLQKGIVGRFIEYNGRGYISQIGRGRGYTTAILFLALQQTICTRRKVALVFDAPLHHVTHTIQETAHDLFGLNAVRHNLNTYHIGGNILRVCRPTTDCRDVRGYNFDDVFLDVAASGIPKNEEFYSILQSHTTRNKDAPGFHFAVFR